MKKCIAFRPLGTSPQAWIPCGRYAVKNSAFCKRHADAMHGSVLGLWVKSFFEPAEPGEKQSEKAAGKKETPGEQPGKHAFFAYAATLRKQDETASELRA
jgi:hypothetical protein